MGPVETGIRKMLGNEFVADTLIKALKDEWNVVEKCDHIFDEWGGEYAFCEREGCMVTWKDVYG